MIELKSLNGAVIQASDDAVPRLLAAGFVRVGDVAPLEQRPKPKAAPRRRAAKPKE